MPLVSELIRGAADRFRDHTAIIEAESGISVSYAAFGDLVRRIADRLAAAGLQRGDRVALCARNSAAWAATEAAAAFAGLTLVPLNIYLSAFEVGWLLRDAGAKAVVFDRSQADTVREAVDGAPECTIHLYCEDPADCPDWAEPLVDGGARGARPEQPSESRELPGSVHRLMYTSATTGVPKGVPYPAEIFVQTMIGTLANQLRDITDGDRLLVTTPLTHVAHGYFWPFFVAGRTSVIMRRFDPEGFCDLVQRQEITHAVMAPTLVSDVVSHLQQAPDRAARIRDSRLRAIWYAGSPIPDSVSLNAVRLLGPILNQQYGLTEMSSGYPATGVTALTAEWHERKRGSCGRPFPGVVLRVVDRGGRPLPAGELGEVCILMQPGKGSYWRPDVPDGNYRDGWLYTGDLGYLDEDGFLFLQDRRTDMIISGGLNVFPTEVESVLLEDPSVAACAVVAYPDERWVEVPHAFVTSRPGAVCDPERLIAFVRSRLAHFKAPRQVYIVDDLPVSATGKLLRREVRSWLSGAPTRWHPNVLGAGPAPAPAPLLTATED